MGQGEGAHMVNPALNYNIVIMSRRVGTIGTVGI